MDDIAAREHFDELPAPAGRIVEDCFAEEIVSEFRRRPTFKNWIYSLAVIAAFLTFDALVVLVLVLLVGAFT